MRSILQLCVMLIILLGAGNRVWGKVAAVENIAVRGFAESEAFGNEVDEPPALMSSGEAAAWGYDLALDVRDGPNLYAYVQQNPWTGFDPHGLDMTTAQKAAATVTVVEMEAAVAALSTETAVATMLRATPLLGMLFCPSSEGPAERRQRDAEIRKYTPTMCGSSNGPQSQPKVGTAIPAGTSLEDQQKYMREKDSNPAAALANLNNAPKANGSPSASPKQQTVVNEQTIKEALKDSPMQPPQDAVSLPMVERYVRRLEAGEEAPPISVDGNVIVDGNHRYVAGKLVGKEPATKAGTLAPSQAEKVKPIKEIKVAPDDWEPHKK